MDWFLDVIKNKYAKFSGRARRKEYWMFQLFCYIFLCLIFLLTAIGLYINNTGSFPVLGSILMGIGSIILTVFMFGLIIPSLALTIRRLHDIGRSGWWILIVAIPYVGPIVLLVFCCLDSESGTNKYGPNPKGVGA
ncbi:MULTISPECIES: DUF805 domain-containing protein [Psychrobacter]|uniref:DUF805 domain-containing protein n=1 Tax=Psychrobacter sanguinis TaxID=861445 RepID=A0A844M288_9GAMM|nr:DUF805 domain-containing protein [Psychrobacter sanguinis]MUG32923.1 DUF805 domain-containing protein [Psychrobacter sanguinis]